MAKTAWGLSGNQLKLIALITMTIDHVGAHLLPQCQILRIIGRISMPIYAFLLAEGCHYTKNKLRYLGLMAGLALGMQLIYFFMKGWIKQCILVTFSLSIILIYALQYVQKKKHTWSCLVFLAALVGAYCFSAVLPKYIPGFSVDYGFKGVLLPVFISLGTNKQQKILGAAVGMCFLALGGTLQWYSLAALPLLALYSGLRGKGNYKYLFYIYYPLHLAVIFAISWISKNTGLLSWLKNI